MTETDPEQAEAHERFRVAWAEMVERINVTFEALVEALAPALRRIADVCNTEDFQRMALAGRLYRLGRAGVWLAWHLPEGVVRWLNGHLGEASMTETAIATVEYAKGDKVRHIDTGDTGVVVKVTCSAKTGAVSLTVELARNEYRTMPLADWEAVQ